VSVTDCTSPALPLGDELSVADLLEDAAAAHRPGDGVPARVRDLACKSLTEEELELAWDAFREARYEREALLLGEVSVAGYRPSLAVLPPAERWQAAVNHACAAADEARAAIQFGIPGGTR
jgi:hypothetical protein